MKGMVAGLLVTTLIRARPPSSLRELVERWLIPEGSPAWARKASWYLL